MQRTDPGRRRFLGALATVGAVSLLPGGVLKSQTGARRIDVHQHFVSPSFHQFLTAKNTPATAVIAELTITASIFQRKVLMPSACAASSSSRIACQ